MPKRSPLRLPVVSASSEYLVMGYLMRRNILAYKAPPGNEGYDLIAIHPDPRHNPAGSERPQVRIQVKSRYASDSNLGFPIKETSFKAFDYVIVVFLNIGKFYGRNDGSAGEALTTFYTLPTSFIREHHKPTPKWEKVQLRGLETAIERYRDASGFELIAKDLGVPRPTRQQIKGSTSDPNQD